MREGKKAGYSFTSFTENCKAALEAVTQCLCIPCACSVEGSEERTDPELKVFEPEKFLHLLQPLGKRPTWIEDLLL